MNYDSQAVLDNSRRSRQMACWSVGWNRNEQSVGTNYRLLHEKQKWVTSV